MGPVALTRLTTAQKGQQNGNKCNRADKRNVFYYAYTPDGIIKEKVLINKG